MRILKSASLSAVVICSLLVGACSEDKTPPTAPAPVAANVTAPALEAPAADAQLDTLRPTLTVRNATSDQAGTRSYEFQVSDSPTFTAATR